MTLPLIPCKPLSEYKGPKPRSWRTYTSYTRPAPFTASCPSTISAGEAASRYYDWLAEARGITREEAAKLAHAQEECKLVSSVMAADDFGKVAKAKAPNWRKLAEQARAALEKGDAAGALHFLKAA